MLERSWNAGGKQIIKLAQACGFGAAVHEIMHALGFWHEQSRPDRDSFVTINWDNIQNGKSHNFNKKAGSEIDSMGSNYDFGSIMHYGKTAFSKNGEDTITPKVAGVTIGQRTGLSAHDIWQVKKLYNCLEDCPNGFYTKKFYRGTAPFCSGTCPRTSREIGRSKTGGGSTCWFGTKGIANRAASKLPRRRGSGLEQPRFVMEGAPVDGHMSDDRNVETVQGAGQDGNITANV